MSGNITTTTTQSTTPLPESATCPDGPNDGLIAGIVICVVLLVVVCGVLMFILAKRKGWISTGSLNFKITKQKGTGQTSGTGDCESSTYQERLPTKDLKSNTPGNMSYEVCLPINAGTGTGTVNVNNEDETAGTRTSAVSRRSYLELIVEPARSPNYENVKSTPRMRNTSDADHKVSVSNDRESDVYINFGSDMNDEKNGRGIPEPEMELFDEIYTNVENSSGHTNVQANNDSDQNTGEGGDYYFVLEKTDIDQTSNQENQSEISDNYFVLEPQDDIKQ